MAVYDIIQFLTFSLSVMCMYASKLFITSRKRNGHLDILAKYYDPFWAQHLSKRLLTKTTIDCLTAKYQPDNDHRDKTDILGNFVCVTIRYSQSKLTFFNPADPRGIT